MTPVSTYAASFRKSIRYYLGGVWRLVNDRPIFLWAQAIAFKVLVSVVPMIILATGVLGLVLRGENTFERIAGMIRNFLPYYQSTQFVSFLEQLGSAGNTITLIGAFGLLFSALTVFTTLRIVVGSVFQEAWHEDRKVVAGYAFDLRMALQVGTIFLLSIGLSVVVQAVNARGLELIREVGLDYAWVTEGWREGIYRLGLVIPFLLTIAMFFQLFFFIPKPHPPRRSALIGAIVTALLWEMAKYGFTFYATRIGRYERYQGEPGDAGIAALGDSFGLIIAFVFWVYYSGVVLVIGAMVAMLHEKQHRVRIRRDAIREVRRSAGTEETDEAGPDALHPPSGGLPVRGEDLDETGPDHGHDQAQEDYSVR